MNPLFCTDFYKIGHIRQYPAGTQYVYSNFTARSAKLAAAQVLPDFDNKVVFFGLQGVLMRLVTAWNQEFFNRPVDLVLAEYQRIVGGALGPQHAGVEHLRKLHALGHLPVRIKALPEGSRVNIGVPLFTIINTDPDFYWLTNFLETQISAEIWKPVTVATIAHEFRTLFDAYAKETGTDPNFVPWQGHDFSARGMSGIADAAQCGAAHLLSFNGSDTVAALRYAEQYYFATGLIGGSVPATEHSVMCMGGENDELGTFRRLITETYPSGIVSIVSDTWDFWRVLGEYAPALREEIMLRDGKVVFRPDSGDPVKIICGDPDAEPGSPEYLGAVELLWKAFGGTSSTDRHDLLDPHVGLIYGDSITLQRAQAILENLTRAGFASGNIVMGIGSYTYQHITRDTFGCAVKATFGVVNGEDRMLFKDPATDTSKTKRSAKGLLRVEQEGPDFVLFDQQTREQEQAGLLRTVYFNGLMLGAEDFTTIRARLRGGAA